jgi:hypothetical protein
MKTPRTRAFALRGCIWLGDAARGGRVQSAQSASAGTFAPVRHAWKMPKSPAAGYGAGVAPPPGGLGGGTVSRRPINL